MGCPGIDITIESTQKWLTRRCYQKKQEVSRECSPGEEGSPVQMRNVWLCRELWGPVHVVQQSCNSPKPWPCQGLRSSVMGYLPSKCVIFRFVWCFPAQTNRALLTDAANLWPKDHRSAIYWDSGSPSVKTFRRSCAWNTDIVSPSDSDGTFSLQVVGDSVWSLLGG